MTEKSHMLRLSPSVARILHMLINLAIFAACWVYFAPVIGIERSGELAGIVLIGWLVKDSIRERTDDERVIYPHRFYVN